jgi:hypothetical protein
MSKESTQQRNIRIDRLKKLADHLEKGKLGHSRFEFGTESEGKRKKNGCGKVGNHAGELAVVWPDDWAMDSFGCTIFGDEFYPYLKNGHCTDDDIMSWFGLDKTMLHHLFYLGFQIPGYYGGTVMAHDSSAPETAALIRDFIRTADENGWPMAEANDSTTQNVLLK